MANEFMASVSYRRQPKYARIVAQRDKFAKFMLKLANNGRMLFCAIVTTFAVAIVLFWALEPVGILGAIHWSVVNAFTQGTQAATTSGGQVLEDIYIPLTWVLLLLAATYFLARIVISLNEYTDEEQQDDCLADQLGHEERARMQHALLEISKTLGIIPTDATELPLPASYRPLYVRDPSGRLVRWQDSMQDLSFTDVTEE